MITSMKSPWHKNITLNIKLQVGLTHFVKDPAFHTSNKLDSSE